MKSLTIRQRIIASFAVVLTLMMIMAALAYVRLGDIERKAALIQIDSIPGLTLTNQIVVERVANYSLTQEFLLQTDMAKKEKLQASIVASRPYLDTLAAQYAPTATTAADRELLDAYKGTVQLYRAAQDAVLAEEVQGKNNREASIKVINAELYPAFVRAQAAAGALVDYNRSEVLESTTRIGAAASSAKRGVLATGAAGLLLALVCGYFLLRAISQPLGRLVTVLEAMRTGDLSGRLRVDRGDEFGTLATGFNRMTDELTSLVSQVQHSGLQVNASVTEIAATAREQQATATEIATTTTEIGATSREISATSKKLVGTMNDVAAVAEHSAILAGEGRSSLTLMEETMGRVMEAAMAINAKLAVLSSKAGNISQVVTTITKVADQTNLLSLNAAIEAEKAGEYGRGFAVVATEIRRLADQTAVATYDIDQMVKEIQSAVAAGVMGMDKFSEEVRRGMEEMQH
ncbi:MAG: methyl-accepting chemotaxis protein, partial [Acidobacteriota bacterium]